jgi:hypothetical protein
MPPRHALLILVFALVVPACATGETPPPPAAERTVTVTHGTVTFVPDASGAEQNKITGEISAFLRNLYRKGFVRPEQKGPTPPPDDAPQNAIAPAFAPAARSHLSGVFTLGRGVELLHGALAYSGGVTSEGNVVTALLAITFSGLGSRTGEGTPVVSFTQSGDMTLQRTETGWFVQAFDLKIDVKPPPPTPTPS